MSYAIRRAQSSDILPLEQMLNSYMRETYDGAWGGSADQLKQDAFGGPLQIFVAETVRQEVIGFIAWIPTYDLHYCLKGGDVIDFYVSPFYRGRGVGLLLVVNASDEIQKQGGTFLKGGAVDDPVVRRSYGRIAMSPPEGESYVSGRAFRHLAGLSGKNIREIVKTLPEVAWNYEP
jgi:GNAT superfamily N-acetyltransferase